MFSGDLTEVGKTVAENGLWYAANVPLSVQRCNGTTAGLGYLKVGWNAMHISL
jgi:hypothetical protein